MSHYYSYVSFECTPKELRYDNENNEGIHD